MALWLPNNYKQAGTKLYLLNQKHTMPDLHERLDTLLQQGCQLFQPQGQALLASAWAAVAWERLRLLYLTENGQLRQWEVRPVASDFDPSTSKLYVAYTEQDYLQLRPLPAKVQPESRKRLQACLHQLCREALPRQAQEEGWVEQRPGQLQAWVWNAARAGGGEEEAAVLGRALWLAYHLQQRGAPLVHWLSQSRYARP